MALNILLVDDSATVRGMIARALSLADVPCGEVFQASNGLEAISVLADQWVDLIITDIHMPQMDGIALIDHVHADPLLRATPVIVVTTEGGAQRLAEIKSKGISAYLRKPFSPEQLGIVVNEALRNHDGQ